MNTNKIERAAVRVIEEYIDKCPKLEPYITSNDKTPIWDGDIYIFNDVESHTVNKFKNRVPLQVKGTENSKEDCFRIGREYLEGFKADRGCAFFHSDRAMIGFLSRKMKILWEIFQIDCTIFQICAHSKHSHSKKSIIFLAFCSLIRTFATDKRVLTMPNRRKIDANAHLMIAEEASK